MSVGIAPVFHPLLFSPGRSSASAVQDFPLRLVHPFSEGVAAGALAIGNAQTIESSGLTAEVIGLLSSITDRVVATPARPLDPAALLQLAACRAFSDRRAG